MSRKTILLTGASGFLGSHLAEELIEAGNRVIALVRPASDLWRCKDFVGENLVFVRFDSKDLEKTIAQHRPDFFMHAAWQGVTSKERNDKQVQLENILFTERMLNLAKQAGVKKMICFGSQAEYGNSQGRMREEGPCEPISEYGRAKLKTLEFFRAFCEMNSMDWLWIRLFALYGTREGNSWLIPSLIKNMVSGKPMDLSGCEQRFDYMYVKDFTKAIVCVLESPARSGIYNLGSNSSVRLKTLVEKVKGLVDPAAVLNYGAIPYAENQIMHLEGDPEKFYRQFNFRINSDLDSNLAEVVNYYKSKFKGETVLKK